MKIGSNNLINFYVTNSKSNVSNKNGTIKTTNFGSSVSDKIEISEKGLRHGEVLAAKINLADSIEKGASEKRILELREKINNGEYNISSYDIAKAILKNK